MKLPIAALAVLVIVASAATLTIATAENIIVNEQNYHQVTESGIVFYPSTFDLTPGWQNVDTSPLAIVKHDVLPQQDIVNPGFQDSVFIINDTSALGTIDHEVLGDPHTKVILNN